MLVRSIFYLFLFIMVYFNNRRLNDSYSMSSYDLEVTVDSNFVAVSNGTLLHQVCFSWKFTLRQLLYVSILPIQNIDNSPRCNKSYPQSWFAFLPNFDRISPRILVSEGRRD